MGLAASQARLLTITSRMSNNEHRQQYLANTKMRLAADQDIAAAKYSEALNNQTLKTANDTPLTMDELEKMGYSIIRPSDKEIAKKATTESRTVYTGTKPTAPKQPDHARISQPEAPVNYNAYRKNQLINGINPVIAAIQDTLNKLNANEVIRLSFDHELERRTANKAIDDINAAKNSLAVSSRQVLSVLDAMNSEGTGLSTSALTNAITRVEAANITKLSTQEDLGDDVFARMTLYPFTNTDENKAIMQNQFNELTAALTGLKDQLSAVITNVSNYLDNVAPRWSKTEEQYRIESAVYDEWVAYDQEYANYQTAYQAYLNTAVEETKEYPENELYANCKNPQFLIQGLLNGYIALYKDNKIVSLDANTDVLTAYDKTDDARAEAEYEAEMKKLNMKEKAIDNQMNRLNTEYSALNIELQSVQNIISKHASEDFKMFA